MTGVKTTYSYLNVETILEPIKAFLPAESVVEVEITETVQSEAPSEFVKERMEEIAAAIDHNNDVEEEVAPLTEALENVDIKEEDETE